MAENSAMPRTPMISLVEANRLVADDAFATTAGNLHALYGVHEDVRCWSLEHLPVSSIDPDQRMDDPSAVESIRKIEAMIRGMRRGATLPPIYVVHHQDSKFPYFLLEGMHRFSSYLTERMDQATAWVAHVDCCGRTPEDAPDE